MRRNSGRRAIGSRPQLAVRRALAFHLKCQRVRGVRHRSLYGVKQRVFRHAKPPCATYLQPLSQFVRTRRSHWIRAAKAYAFALRATRSPTAFATEPCCKSPCILNNGETVGHLYDTCQRTHHFDKRRTNTLQNRRSERKEEVVVAAGAASIQATRSPPPRAQTDAACPSSKLSVKAHLVAA